MSVRHQLDFIENRCGEVCPKCGARCVGIIAHLEETPGIDLHGDGTHSWHHGANVIREDSEMLSAPYSLARRLTLESGRPYTDPRNGQTTIPGTPRGFRPGWQMIEPGVYVEDSRPNVVGVVIRVLIHFVFCACCFLLMRFLVGGVLWPLVAVGMYWLGYLSRQRERRP